jgi:two-component system repressor protein LuxO
MTENTKSLVLLIEDQPIFALTCQAILRNEAILITHVKTGEAAITFLKKNLPHVILLDLGLPDMNGMEILRYVKKQKLGSPVIVITAQNDIGVVVEAMRCGAFDFLEKPFEQNRLIVTLRNALQQQSLSKQVNLYKQRLYRERYYGFIGASEPMQTIYRIIDNVATSKASVFITGESGTGKELCAEAIHQGSQRQEQPFITINCAAIPSNLMESELFGHVKGAFTSADRDREGAASAANGGTLFLDEIGDLDLNLQSKLLRFIQTGTIQKVGSSKSEKVDIRFICATNREPLAEIESDNFREDLYYRLNVIPIHLPPLRKREDDVLFIARELLMRYAEREKKLFVNFAPEVETVLKRYNWPGNVRQLDNVIQNMVVLNNGAVVTLEMLPPPLDLFLSKENLESQSVFEPSNPPDLANIMNLPFRIRPLWQIEKEAIEQTIDFCEGDIIKAASVLEIHSSTIYRKLRSWKEKL